MIRLLHFFLLFISTLSFGQSYKQIHADATVIDTHNDVLISILKGLSIEEDLTGKTHSDIERFRKGGVDVQVFSIWSDERYGNGKGFRFANRQIDSLYAITARNKHRLMIVTNPAQLIKAVGQKKLGVMMGMEGGHMIEDNLSYLDSLYNRGVRYMTLTWNNSTSWATSAADETSLSFTGQKGLSTFGQQVIKRMNELGMMVDLSHAGEKMFWDVMKLTTKPVLVSHSCVYALCPHRRNLKDDQIKAIAKNDGVIHINFYSGFLDSNYEKRKNTFLREHAAELDSLKSEKLQEFEIDMWLTAKYPKEMESLHAPFSILIDHIEYIIKLAGIDHVGLGSDYDGIESPPQHLEDVSKLPLITKALLEKGYSKKDIEKILGGNFIRVFKANQTNSK